MPFSAPGWCLLLVMSDRAAVGDGWPTSLLVAAPALKQGAPARLGSLLRRVRRGGPAFFPHLTLLYPFTSRAGLTPEDVLTLERLVSSVPTFSTALSTFGSFEDVDVLYLKPEPDEPFRVLMTLISQAFPDFPPYEGKYDTVVPHVTVCTGSRSPRLVDDLSRRLPLPWKVDEVHLVEVTPRGFLPVRRFCLANAST